ncbi:hypothetical protein [Sporosarcina sp. USHLN248]|uniref:hypothetical protein n=1 Tax=Sporosarcina sp. USHLN248 TaxID=3081300 RepID=UPI00301B2A5E
MIEKDTSEELIKRHYESKLPELKLLKIIKSPRGIHAYFGQRKGFPIREMEDLFEKHSGPIFSFCQTEQGKRFLYFDPLNRETVILSEIRKQLNAIREADRLAKEKIELKALYAAEEAERLQQIEFEKRRRLNEERARENKMRMEQERAERDKRYRMAKEEALRLHRKQNRGFLSFLFKQDPFRETHCYRCKTYLFSSTHPICPICKWLICNCCACGCDFMKG